MKTEDINRTKSNLAYMRAHPYDPCISPEWRKSVLGEARALGLLPPARQVMGANVQPGIDPPFYGGDLADVF